jgi:hypothetical protein
MKKIFLIAVLFASLNAYQFENKDVESVSKIIQQEYLKCLDGKKIGFSECNSIRDKKLNNLSSIDDKESYSNHIAKVKEDRDRQSKLPPVKLSSSAEIVKNNMNSCLDRAQTREDNQACIKSLTEGKFRVKQELTPIISKNKVHVATDNEKPDLSTLLKNKNNQGELNNRFYIEKKTLENKDTKEVKTATIIKKIESNEEPVTPKKKVRFKN